MIPSNAIRKVYLARSSSLVRSFSASCMIPSYAIRKSTWSSSLVRSFSAASSEYDVVIVGGGPGGYVAAIKASQMGMKVSSYCRYSIGSCF